MNSNFPTVIINIRLSLASNYLLSLERKAHHLSNQREDSFYFKHGTLEPKRQKTSMFGGIDLAEQIQKSQNTLFNVRSPMKRKYQSGEETVEKQTDLETANIYTEHCESG